MMNARVPLLSLSLLWVTTAAQAEPPAHLARGIELFEAGTYEAAAEFFSTAPREPGSSWLAYYRGRTELARGELDSAIELLAQAADAEPDSALFQRWLAEAYVAKLDTVGMLKKMGLAQKAKAGFERAVQLAPADPEARAALADYYLNAPAIAGGSQQKARQQAAELAALDPAAGRALMGRIHLGEEEWEQAAAAFRDAAAADPHEPRHRYQRAFALQQSRNWAGAFAEFEAAIELDPDYLPAYYQLARTAVFAQANLERAAECLRYYLSREPRFGHPGHQHAHWRLGMVLELAGQRDAAAAEYRAALELDPEHREARQALAALER